MGMPHITLPDVFPYLLAILGLLLVWQLHAIQVRAGRIKAAHAFDRSGTRFFLRVTPGDGHACAGCQAESGTALLPALATGKKAKPLSAACTNPAGCRCLLVGLYGAWPEAGRLLQQLKAGTGQTRLSPEQFEKFLAEAQARRTGIAVDQVAVGMLGAMAAEESDPKLAIEGYRSVMDQAKKDRDLPLVIPAYLRLTELLERTGQQAEALAVVDRFLAAYGKKPGPAIPQLKPPPAATDDQLNSMSIRKTRLMTGLKR
jgi:hypothetical protein